MDWNVVYKPIHNSGLGIWRVKYHNSALLAKWLWKFGRERDSLWRRVVAARFGEQSVQEFKAPRGKHGCGIWKSILKVKESFWRFIRFQLGSGLDIKVELGL